MGTISEESIRKVLEITDIVDLINSYIPLKRAGSGWKGVCPFHNDTHPSMTVNPTRQSFMCFACQTGGDALSFVMKYENLGFVDALRKLADRAGVVLIEEQTDASEDQRRRRGKSLVEVNKMAAEYFHSLLKRSPHATHARDYLNSRGYGSDMAGRWRVGWSPAESGDFLRWAKSKSIPPEMLIEAGLASENERGGLYARFRDRLMFPINNDRGECVGFSGRLLQEVPNAGKYVNTPETPIFKKGFLCFGLDKAQVGIRDAKAVLICEGQVDVIACHEAGITYTVASLGTAFTPDHARLLKRRTDKAILCFDADAAGIKASDRAFKALAAEGMEVLMVRLPAPGPGEKGDDPDSFIKREGAAAFQSLVDQAVPFLAARLELGKTQGRLGNASSAAAFAHEIADLIAAVKDPIMRSQMSDYAAPWLQAGLSEMRQAVQTSVKSNRRNQQRQPTQAGQGMPEQPPPPMVVDRAVLILCQLALQDRATQELIAERIEDLVEPMDILAGGVILKQILNKLPDPSDPAAIHLFIRSLPPDQSRAVQSMNIDPITINNPVKVVDEACAALSYVSLEKQLNMTLAALKSPGISAEERLALMKKSVDMKSLLTNISPRTP